MTRKVIDVSVSAEGRDKGKTFRLTEMDAWASEEWGIRALTVMNRANVDLPVEAFVEGASVGLGWMIAAAYGVRALLSANFDEAKPLLDEMLTCVQRVPAPEREPDIVRRLVPDDIEEIMTLLWLRERVIELHTGFSVAAALADLRAHAAAVQAMNQPVTPTSRKGSRRSSPPS